MDAGRVSICPRGEYNSSATYERLDMVSYQGGSYIAIKQTVGHLPTDTNYWQLGMQSNVDGDFNKNSTNAIANKEVTIAFDSIRDNFEFLGVKNMLNVVVAGGSSGGVSYINSNGRIIVNGTSNSDIHIALSTVSLKKGKYHFSGCPTGGSVNTYYLRLTGAHIDSVDFGLGFDFELPEDDTVSASLDINTNVTFSNKEFRPMIVFAYDDENDYNHFVPFVPKITMDTRVPQLDTTPSFANLTELWSLAETVMNNSMIMFMRCKCTADFGIGMGWFRLMVSEQNRAGNGLWDCGGSIIKDDGNRLTYYKVTGGKDGLSGMSIEKVGTEVDTEVNATSTNPVQNKAIYNYIDNMITKALNGTY